MRKYLLLLFGLLFIGLLYLFFFREDFKKSTAHYLIQKKLTDDVLIVRSKNFNMLDTLLFLSNNKNIFEIEGLYNLEQLNYYKKQNLNLTTKVNMTTQYLLSGSPKLSLELLNDIYSINSIFFLNYLKVRYAYIKRLKSEMFSSYNFDENWGNKPFQVGLCNLRLSEIYNCQINSNESSCVLPFIENAIHKNGEFSSEAAHQFELALKNRPNDPVARWLLNIAYATMGNYLENVPDKYLIDFEKFSSKEIYVKKFSNIAEQLGVNSNTYYGGVAMEDFNNDGFLDLFVTSADLNDNVSLFINDGKGGFQDFTAMAGLEGITGGVNVIHADFNNDGFEDIYIIRGGWMNMEGTKHPNSLLKNNGNGTFTDVTESVGLLSFWSTHTACWGDINNDGHLDLFVGNERGNSHVFLNNGDGTFKECSKEVGILLNEYVKGATWLDYDNDGFLDLYVSTYVGKNRLYKNLGINSLTNLPKFKDVAKQAGVQEPFYSFPVVAFDFNNDGFLDILCSDFKLSIREFANNYINNKKGNVYPRLYINNGDGTFTDKWYKYGDVRQTLSMGINVGDINNDGYEDIYLGTGYPDFAALVPNLMYLNLNGVGMADVTSQSGLGHLQKGHGIAFGDFDNDGDQDIYLNLGGWYSDDKSPNAFFENNNQDNNHNWVVLKLVGNLSNKSAIGARVKLIVSDLGENKREIYRVVSTGGSYGSKSLQLEVGIGKANQIDLIEIIWPNKDQTKQVLRSLPINSKLIITEETPNF